MLLEAGGAVVVEVGVLLVVVLLLEVVVVREVGGVVVGVLESRLVVEGFFLADARDFLFCSSHLI